MATRLGNAIKHMKIRDILAPFVFLVLFIPSLIFRLSNRLKKRKLWLVAEEGEARDNGYHFYKYVREKHPGDYCFYVIKPESAGYEKVIKLGNVIKWGSLKHWLYYMSANLNISSQKSGNPAPMFWYVMHVKMNVYNNRVFLQHGITKDDSKWLYHDQTHFKYFVCGAKREYDYILKTFGYREENLLLTGFPRWDNLKDVSKKQSNKSILIMPTWRNWLGGDINKTFAIKDFLKTDFYKRWSAVINDEKFIRFIEKNNIKVYFYPHAEMQRFLKYFSSMSKNVKMISTDSDIQNYFGSCSLMITDYSSVAFDFAYLKKPVIYYQFDIKEYRSKQLQKGYFSYEEDGFGPVVKNEKDLIESVKKMIGDGLNNKYEKRFDKFFVIHNKCNTECLYNVLIGKNKKKKIMHVVNGMNFGGIETFIMNIYRRIDHDKYEFIFLTNKPGQYDYQEEAEALGGRFVKVDSAKSGQRLKHLIQVNKAIKVEKPDVVHCHTYFDAATVMLAAKHNKIKVRITHSHTTEGKDLGRKALHSVLAFIIRKSSTKLIACGEEAGLALYKRPVFETIQNGINLTAFSYNEVNRQELRRELGLKKTDIVIGHVGRLVEVKNHAFLLKIVEQLVLADKKYKLVLVGNGPLKNKLRKIIKDYNLGNNVILLGDRDDVCRVYSLFDIVVFPSIYEGLPMVLIEAQANGLPVLASSSIDSSSKVNDNFKFLNLKDEAEYWAKEIIKADIKRQKPSKKIEEYSIEKTVARIEEIYES